MTGMAISFVGGILFLPSVDVSINMISLFGFLMVLGIVVDDAVVVGENVFEQRQQGWSRCRRRSGDQGGWRRPSSSAS
jgi:multidrug efflux pump subunit AcrB